ncbi:M9 family metallopeptidase N-terminal domain-containing protein [Bacillus paranthracis]
MNSLIHYQKFLGNKLSDLFQFNQDTKAFYQNKERMNVNINELGQRGRTFSRKKIQRALKHLLKYYVLLLCGYYNNELSYLGKREASMTSVYQH